MNNNKQMCLKETGINPYEIAKHLTAIDFVKEKYNIELEKSEIHCIFSSQNHQCIKERCSYYK